MGIDHLDLRENLSDSNTLFTAALSISEVKRAELLMEYLINSRTEFSGQNVAYKLVNHPEARVVGSIINKMKEAKIPVKRMHDEDYQKYAIHKMKQNMASCDSNKLIAEYMEIEDQINWDKCATVHDDL